MNPLLSAMYRRFRRFKSAGARTDKSKGKAKWQRLRVEVLEDRTVPTAVAAPANLISWWTANNTAADAMGLNNATLSNVTYATGEVGNAFRFNGVNGWPALGDPSSLAFTNSFTIEGWIKVNGLPTNYNFGTIMFRGDDRAGLDPYTLVVLPNGDLHFGINGYPTGNTSIEAPVPMGQFVHVAATLDDPTGLMTLYENRAVVAQTTTTVRPFGALDPTLEPGVGIGNSNALDNYNVPFNGLIDELSVYNRALTAGQVFGIYKAGSSGKVISPVAVDYPSVINGSGGATTPVTFTITRTGSLSGSLAVNWTTADDTAIAGTDYVAASGTLTFADGQATQTVQVTTLNNTTPKPNEDFKLIVTPAGGTAVMGLATILTDNTTIAVGKATAVEGSNTLKLLDRFVSNGSGGLARPRGAIFGPDANGDGKPDLYVTSADTNAVLRFDGVTGSYIDTFVAPGSGGLHSPVDLAYGSDGKLYVTSYSSNQLLRYDGTTGAFIDVVSNTLSGPEGITLGPDGNLYIANYGTNEVLRYNTTSGLTSFVPAGSGGLSGPRKAIFGPDANGDGIQDLYVTSESNSKVLRFDGVTGAYIDTFVSTGTAVGAMWLQMGTDGYVYVLAPTTTTGGGYESVSRYNATGNLIDSNALGLEGWAFTLGSGNIIYDSGTGAGPFVDRIGPSSIVAFSVNLAWPSATPTTVSYSTADGTAVAGVNYTAVSGTLTFAPGETAKGILVPTLNDGVADPTRSFTVNLSNPTGGVLANTQAVGTILDDTKFYVVDGGTSDSTYQYASAGSALGSNTLASGDTAPRGVADTAAGTTTWVVDANKNVYVYSTGGALLGSWSAGGLSSSAQLTGIATNGTDIWLLDGYNSKVYQYTGAASLLSGSQNAASSFSLSGGNSNATDMVTDGTYLWVVNANGKKSKVFKYTVAGSSKGSWTIDAANTSPTGITINPSNVSDIWIVDNGTKKVYQYTAAASRTSGSQNAAATFALASGDTNPQGIADPPVADMMITAAPAPLAQNLPSVPAFNAASINIMPIVPALPSLAGRDAAFTMLARETFQSPGVPAINLMTSGQPAAHQPATPTVLTSLGSERNAVGLLDGVWVDSERQASGAATDSFFAMLADDAPAEASFGVFSVPFALTLTVT
jgi:hypothetical protein